ncbi:MAG: two-component regulator propeller domain-containing protein, partial [bacterium]
MNTPRVICAVVVTLLVQVAARDAAAQAPGVSGGPSTSPQTWVHESWTTKDGLPVNSVNGLVQDRTGYLWAATFDGLVRFDGIRFTVFNTANSEGLPSNRIVQLSEGRDGALWLATEQSHIVRFRAGRFENIAFENGRPGGNLPTMFVDSSGAVWVGTPEGLWNVRGDRLVRVGKGTLDTRVTSVMRRRDGTMWVGTAGAGIFKVTGGTQVAKVPTLPDIDADFINRLIEDPSGTLWIAGNRGLWTLRDHAVRIPGPPLSLVTDVVQVRATGVRYAETAAGVYRIDSANAVLIRRESSIAGKRLWSDGAAVWTVNGTDVFRDERQVFTLAEHRTVSSALFDREGNLWIGTDAGGLHRLKEGLFTTYSVAEGVSYPNVYATYADRAGKIWLGTWGKGASRLDPVTGRATIVGDGKMPLSVNSFHEDGSGAMWMATATGEGGLLRCTPPAMSCRVERPRELGDRAVLALYGDADGRLWAGASGALFRYDGKTWTTFPTSFKGREATVRAFASTTDGALWMGTNGAGLVRYREGTLTYITSADGLPSDLIRSLYQDADGWLWVGTEGRGLARLDPRAWSDARTAGTNVSKGIVHVGSKHGLFDDVIHQILEDDRGRLWMNTNRGIFWVERAELNAFAEGKASTIHSIAYTERDGIRNREGNGGVQPAGAKGPDGRLWFPTQDGVVVVNPADIGRERIAPRVVVERMLAGGETVRPEHDSIALRPSQRNVQIEFTALTFVEPTNVRFRYRLDPYDTAWVDAGNRRTAFYTKVPPGHYSFIVEASDLAGGWHEPGTRLAVHVIPQLIETTLFRWAVLAAFGLLLFGGVRFRELRLRGRAKELQQLVDERTAALRDREHELADRNAR